MPIESALTPCCRLIPERVFGRWEPHDPRARCDGLPPTVREVEEDDAAYHAERLNDEARDDRAIREAEERDAKRGPA